MPRQPYNRVVPTAELKAFDIGTNSIGKRPHLEALVGNCLMAWPHVEAEMALVLGQLLGATNTAAIAVFQTLRRSTAQRDAIAAATVGRSAAEIELVSAILNVHKSIEAERTALAHGHFGSADDVPDGLLWMNTGDYITIRTELTLLSKMEMHEERRKKIASMVYVYREPDLTQIMDDLRDLAWIWFWLVIYLKYQNEPQGVEAYRQLCDRPRVAQELEKLRQKNTPSTQPPAPQPTENGTA
jgi:hypothetical protein